MSIADRKIREKEEMHRLILDGARKVFLEKGYEGTSIRNIAESINYSPGTIYFYFKDKSEIFHELHEEGFRQLLGRLQVLESVADPFERLRAMGWTFIKFAHENRGFYELMFMVKDSEEAGIERWKMGGKTLDSLKSVIRACQEKGRFKGLDVDYLSFMMLSSLHGMCALYCSGRVKIYTDKTAEQLMQHGYDSLMLMMGKM